MTADRKTLQSYAAMDETMGFQYRPTACHCENSDYNCDQGRECPIRMESQEDADWHDTACVMVAAVFGVAVLIGVSFSAPAIIEWVSKLLRSAQ